MKSMKTSVLCCVLALSAIAAQAETLTIDVPFAFSAGGKALPAGSYTLETAGNTLSLHGLPGGAMMMVYPDKTSAWTAPPRLSASFAETSDGNVLASVTTPNGVMYTVAPAKKTAMLLANPPAGAVLSKRP